MQVRKVQDPKGVWLVNVGAFTFVDPTNGTRFDPQIPTQASLTDWVKTQDAIIKPWVDPAEEEAAKQEMLEAASKQTQAEASKATKK